MTPISVIIPTHNRWHTLSQALVSVLSQENVLLEVIVIDDGSTDGTREMIRDRFPQVEYFFQKNQGPAAARNRGIEKARGKWVAFLDSDDEWLPGKLKAQLDFFDQHPELLIAQTEEIWVRNGKRVNPMKKHQKFGGWIFEKCLPLCVISPSAVMIHRKIFDEVGLFDESYPACEDYELWLRIASKFPVGLIEKPLIVKYGGHPDQRSHEFPAMDLFRIRALTKILDAGTLNSLQRDAALRELEEKIRIYSLGAKKRGKAEEIEELSKLVKRIKTAM